MGCSTATSLENLHSVVAVEGKLLVFKERSVAVRLGRITLGTLGRGIIGVIAAISPGVDALAQVVNASPNPELSSEVHNPDERPIDENGIDYSSGKLMFDENLITSRVDHLSLNLRIQSPGLNITGRHLTSDPALSVSNSLGQIVYMGLDLNSYLTVPPEDFSGDSPGKIQEFHSSVSKARFINGYDLKRSSGQLKYTATGGYNYVGDDGTTASVSPLVTAMNIYTSYGDQNLLQAQLVENIVLPNGEILTYYYDSSSIAVCSTCDGLPARRIRYISSNMGFAMQFSYEINGSPLVGALDVDRWFSVTKVTRFNLSQTYCDLNATTRCKSDSTNAQSVLFSYDRAANTVAIERFNGRSTKIWLSVEGRWGASRIVAIEQGGLAATKKIYDYVEYPIILSSNPLPNPRVYQDNVQSVAVDGKVWSYEYKVFSYNGQFDNQATLKRIDPNGGVKKFDMAMSQDPPTRITDELGRVTKIEYFRYSVSDTTHGAIVSSGSWPTFTSAYQSAISWPLPAEGASGGNIEYLYDGRGNRVRKTENPTVGHSVTPINWIGSYAPNCGPENMKICNKVLQITDPRGNTTNYSYSNHHGGVIAEWGSAPVPGSLRPLLKYDYILKYAFIRDAGGGLTQVSHPVWLRSSVAECAAVSSDSRECDPGQSIKVTSYQYGQDGTPDSLLVHGIVESSNGVEHRTCINHDKVGNRTSITRTSASLGTCP